MKTFIYIFVSTFCIILFSCSGVIAKDSFWTIEYLDNPAPGYLTFDNPNPEEYFFSFCTVDHYGKARLYETDSTNISNEYLKPLSNGKWSMVRESNLFIFDENFNITDTLRYPNNYEPNFRDILQMPNGNYLLMCDEWVFIDMSQLVRDGDPEAEVVVTKLVEVNSESEVVWTWDPLDHMEVTDATVDIDLTQKAIDFNHGNSLFLTDDGDILFSARHLDEITKIDRQTGDIVWRMGGSKCKNNQFTFVNDTISNFFGFSHQHSVHITERGTLLLFDNGNGRFSQFSRAVEYELDTSEMTATKIWEYRHPDDIYSDFMGSVQRLPNGNTIVNWSYNDVMEVKPDGSLAMKISVEIDPVYRVYKTFTGMNAVMKFISEGGTYTFNDDNNNTGITIIADDLTGSGNVSLEKHSYAPPDYSLPDSLVTGILPLRWVIRYDSLENISGLVAIDLSNLSFENDFSKIAIFNRVNETIGDFEALTTTYQSNNNRLVAEFDTLGEFIICSYELSEPSLTFPENNAINISVNSSFIWDTVSGAQNYHIQIAEDPTYDLLVDSAIVPANSYKSELLDGENIYYWRVAAISEKDTSDWSENFSFSTKMNKPILFSPMNKSRNISKEARFYWKKYDWADVYLLQVSESDGFSEFLIDVAITDTTYKMDDLAYGENYFWRVKCLNSSDTSNWSNVWTFRTEIQKPIQIDPYYSQKDTPVNGIFRWRTISEADSFAIQVATESDFNVNVIDAKGITEKYYAYTGLEYNKEYFWRVRQYYETDSSDWSVTWKFITNGKPKLDHPILTTPENGSTENSSDGIFEWQIVNDAEHYSLQVSDTITFDNLIIDAGYIDTGSFEYSDLEYNKKYFWKVKAYSENDVSEWSEIWEFSTMPNPMKKYKYIRIIYPFYNSINIPVNGFIKWDSIPIATHYQVQVTDFYFHPDSLFLDTITNNTIIEYNGLKINEKYFWRVRYFTEHDTSRWNYPCLFTTEPIELLESPALKYPVDSIKKVPVKLNFEWENKEDNCFTRIELSRYPYFFPWKYIFRDLSGSTFYHDTLRYNTRYYWRAMATNDSSYSIWTDVESFVTQLKPPRIIYPHSGVEEVNPNGDIIWDTVKTAEYYSIDFSSDPNFDNIIISEDIYDELSYHYSLQEHTLYYYRLKALSNDNESSWTVDSLLTGEYSIFSEGSLTGTLIDIYPNPAKNEIILDIKNNENKYVKIEIVNTFGQLLKEYDHKMNTSHFSRNIRIEDLSNGIYYMIINSGAERYTRKLIVVK